MKCLGPAVQRHASLPTGLRNTPPRRSRPGRVAKCSVAADAYELQNVGSWLMCSGDVACLMKLKISDSCIVERPSKVLSFDVAAASIVVMVFVPAVSEGRDEAGFEVQEFLIG